MKNRTSLTLVISLLVCIMTTGAFAQTNPSVLKPEDSTLEPRENDVQSAPLVVNQPACSPGIPNRYKVVPDDKVYLQISNVKLRADNLPINPFFRIFGGNGKNWMYITQTYSQAGNQICEKVAKPSNFQFFIDSTYQDCFINVFSKLHTGDQLVARGVSFKTAPLIQWAIPQNIGKTYPNPLVISKGNTIKLKFISVANNNTRYYFEIISYEITSLEKSFVESIQNSYNSFEPKLNFNGKEYSPESCVINSKSLPMLSFTNKKPEVLLSCNLNGTYTFSVKNNQGLIDTIVLPTNEITKQLNDCIKRYPEDYKKWIVKCVSKHNSELELSFAGIRRVYCVTTVKIPKIHDKHEFNRYAEKGYSPWLRVYIRQNALPCGIKSDYAKSGIRAWNCDFPNDENNRFLIREGVKSRFSLQICDADTWAYEISLVEITGLTDLDFKKGIIYEEPVTEEYGYNVDSLTRIQVEEVKE